MEVEHDKKIQQEEGTEVTEKVVEGVEEKEEEVEEEPFYQPTDIAFKSMVFDTQFHPSRNILAAGLVSGFVKL